MKKRIISCMLVVALAAVMIAIGAITVSADATVAKIGSTGYASLQDALTAASGMANKDVTITLTGNVEWATGSGHGSTPLIPADSSVKSVTIVGNGTYNFTATGNGVGSIRAANGALLTFKKVNIIDESVSYDEGAWELGYLEMAQNLKFVDCNINSPIILTQDNGNAGEAKDCNAEFINCNFKSEKDSEYSVWVGHGSAAFTGCTFTGTRAVKIHECYGSNIIDVNFDNCSFGPLSKKPGIAIGDIYMNGADGHYGGNTWTDTSDTSITILNCTFENVQPGDQGLYIYETDTDVSTFNFEIREEEPGPKFTSNFFLMMFLKRLHTYYEITPSTTEGGSITFDGDWEISDEGNVLVRFSKDITFTITPDEGYILSDLLIDGESVGAVSEYTFARVKKPHTISAVFAPAETDAD